MAHVCRKLTQDLWVPGGLLTGVVEALPFASGSFILSLWVGKTKYKTVWDWQFTPVILVLGGARRRSIEFRVFLGCHIVSLRPA